VKNKLLYFTKGKKMEKLIALFKEEDGVTALEYTVLAALVIIAIIAFFTPIRTAVTAIWTQISNALTAATA
jgi:pilus assembly protein Flp/PilA